jgi:plastocyanin
MNALSTLLWLWLSVVPRAAEVTHARVAREHTIQVSNAAPFYAPAAMTIRAGETVHWRSGRHSDTHSVREALHGTFSIEIPPGGDVSHQFRRAGEYQYRCRYHPWMVGRIVVEPKRLAVQWQPFPPTLHDGRLVAGEGGVYLVGPGAQPDIARLEGGRVVPLGALDRRIRPDVPPGAGADGALWFAGEAPGTLVRFDGTSAVHKPAHNPLSALAPATGGSVWFHDGARIGRFHPATGVQWVAALAEPLTAMRAGTDGRLWLLDRTGRAGVLEDARIAWTTVDVLPRLTVGEGVAWMVSASRGKLLRLDPNGTVLEFTVPPSIGSPHMLVPTVDGVWIANERGAIAQLIDGQIEEYEMSPPARRFRDVVGGQNAGLWLLDAEGHRIGHVAAEVRTLARLR